ncbi:unnamed protein product [Closterium sp. Yama58-4]|nr:unnamed protein product [Closterium sp. Yama58-4]
MIVIRNINLTTSSPVASLPRLFPRLSRGTPAVIIMGSMRASPAGLLLLSLALIAAVQMMKTAYGDDTVKSMAHRTAHRSMLKTTDPACAALGCEPAGGTCEVDGNGKRYCKWDSPCGACPTGATCKTVPASSNSSVQVPYCACPKGFGMTATKCVAGGRPTVSSFSSTFIANRYAKDASSRPYTFRVNLAGCTQFPAAVVGKVTTIYIVDGIGDAPSCRSFKNYAADNCKGASESGNSVGTPHAGYVMDILPLPLRSVRCIR